MPPTPALAATYRLQFNGNFRFCDAIALVDYLHELGISDVYSSPILASRRGSEHGYDVTDPTRIDPDLGTLQEFEEFEERLLARNMRLILDIVPNHMAASNDNRWWMDILENGSESGFASYFDIDWHPPLRRLEGKVLLPVLGRTFGETLDRGELRLLLEDGKFFVQYFDSIFPLTPASYHRILKYRVEELRNSVSEESPTYQEYSGIIAALSALLENRTETAADKRIRLDAIRGRLHSLLANNPDIAAFVSDNVASFNGNPGDVASLCALEHLLGEQHFLLAYWQDPNEGINYRRFFAISDLVGVRVEDPLVFEATHDQIFRLISKGAIRGLRVDHIDGLRDPLSYLSRLQERLTLGQMSSSKPSDSGLPYVVVEKILSPNETLPQEWPVSGTTGYEFLNAANSLFVSPTGACTLEQVYFDFIGKQLRFPDVVREKKKLVMNTLLRVEMRSLGRRLANLAAGDRYARHILRPELTEALIEITSCLPVYRTYIRNLDVPDSAKQAIETAIDKARASRPQLSDASFGFLRDVLTLANPPHILADQREERLEFVMRWQQFTGSIVAKGVEDTALYVYYPLLSLNEVGGNPEASRVVSREAFYEFIQKREQHWPETMNATSTHDTKRSEDLRARLNVLSEVPEEWAQAIKTWSRETEHDKTNLGGRIVPDANEEYLIYQTLAGLWPSDEAELPAICKRVQDYAVKALREAMVHTRWTEPNRAHEKAICDFIERILASSGEGAFVHQMTHFRGRIAYPGMVNSLGQTLLKIACPGAADFYQGSELWDYHLVDPDNRTPVDFGPRCGALKSVTERNDEELYALLCDLLQNWENGHVKMFLIWKALGWRRDHAELFREGEFLPLQAAGERQQHLVAFLRRHGTDQALVAIPRWTVNAPQATDHRGLIDFWRGTSLHLLAGCEGAWQNIFTKQELNITVRDGQSSLSASDLFQAFPVALLAPITESPLARG